MTKSILEGAPKELTPVTVNGGNYHMRNGQLIAGISNTQAAPMSETPSLEIFDKLGKIRRDFTEDEVEALTPERRERFFVLIEAATNAEAAEQEVRDADAEIALRVRELTTAEMAHRKAFPPRTFIEELRATINRPKE
jgi:hypothetical protein